MLSKTVKARRRQNKTLRQLRHLIHLCKRGNQKSVLAQAERYFGKQSSSVVALVDDMERLEKQRAQQTN